MKKKSTLLFICLIISALISSSYIVEQQQATSLKAYTLHNLNAMLQAVQNLENNLGAQKQELNIAYFDTARYYYKKIEPIIAYFSPEAELKLNGAAVLESKPHAPNEIKYPTGFQVLEALIAEQSVQIDPIKNEISNIYFTGKKLKQIIQDVSFTSSAVMDATKLNIYRLIGKGMAGFDSPILLHSIKEATYTLEGTKDILTILGSKNKHVNQSIDTALAYLHNNTADFNQFNRAVFIKDFLNPICNQLHDYYKLAGIPFDTLYPKLIPANKANMFVKDAFDWSYFAPSDKISINQQNIALGKSLFNDVRLSVNNSRSCASCHIPSKGFTDGKKLNETLVGNELLLRNTPTLINAAYQPAQFYDKRIAFLEDQIHDVISNPNEMGGIFDTILTKISQDKYYKVAFQRSFKTKHITERQIKQAIATYIRSLSGFNSRFDQYMNGNTLAMNTLEIKGFNLFMGKAKCGTCHFVPLFSGTLPPIFHKIEAEIIGVPSDAGMHTLDKDEGIYKIYNAHFQKHAFKTSTVRNAGITAPYMHNGAFNTLEEVIEFYNIGGGQQLGFNLPYQTLPPDSLLLSNDEKNALQQFMLTLTDTTSFQY